jgi:hypothetical protein
MERFEASVAGRTALTALLLFTLTAMIVSNLPDSELRRTGLRVADPFLDVTGLHQNWNLFAPDPRRITLQLEARIVYADGQTVLWHPSVGDPVVGVYATFRWRKWASYVVSRANSSALWAPTADWVARTHLRDGRYPARVVLVRRSYLAPLPGRGTTQPPYQSQILYTARYKPDGARA